MTLFNPFPSESPPGGRLLGFRQVSWLPGHCDRLPIPPSAEQWRCLSQRFPSSTRRKERVTVAGQLPSFTGFPCPVPYSRNTIKNEQPTFPRRNPKNQLNPKSPKGLLEHLSFVRISFLGFGGCLRCLLSPRHLGRVGQSKMEPDLPVGRNAHPV